MQQDSNHFMGLHFLHCDLNFDLLSRYVGLLYIISFYLSAARIVLQEILSFFATRKWYESWRKFGKTFSGEFVFAPFDNFLPVEV